MKTIVGIYSTVVNQCIEDLVDDAGESQTQKEEVEISTSR